MRHIAHMRNSYKILDTKHKGKRPLRGCKHRFKVNIKMDLKKQGVGMWTGFKVSEVYHLFGIKCFCCNLQMKIFSRNISVNIGN